MTTTITRQATPPAVLDFDARLALADAAMTARLDEARVRFEIDTARPAEPTPEITIPLAPAVAPNPYRTPLAQLLHRARTRMEAGWCRGALIDEDGAVCSIGAIRAEAHGDRGLADDACALLLEAIRRDFPDADTIPSWNDSQSTDRQPLRYLDRAAELAHARDL